MDETEGLKEIWRRSLDRVGDAGRRWRKSLIATTPCAEPLSVDDAECGRLKDAIRAARRARHEGHWSFRPERLRQLMARYVAALKAKRERGR